MPGHPGVPVHQVAGAIRLARCSMAAQSSATCPLPSSLPPSHALQRSLAVVLVRRARHRHSTAGHETLRSALILVTELTFAALLFTRLSSGPSRLISHISLVFTVAVCVDINCRHRRIECERRWRVEDFLESLESHHLHHLRVCHHLLRRGGRLIQVCLLVNCLLLEALVQCQ
mmetsp:Transcript_35869/g.105037  ORF Transcript_35869/g.105037 Transcript_35869/m.105037 type:complete len:173 (-) Transcript_35869:1493-2011(-)